MEICDVLTRTGGMIHIKQRGASSTLSHLFAQGINSAERLLQDAEFRRQARELVEREDASFSDVLPAGRPVDPSTVEVTFAVITRSNRGTPLNLPFFSLVSLRARCRASAGVRLPNFGCRGARAGRRHPRPVWVVCLRLQDASSSKRPSTDTSKLGRRPEVSGQLGPAPRRRCELRSEKVKSPMNIAAVKSLAAPVATPTSAQLQGRPERSGTFEHHAPHRPTRKFRSPVWGGQIAATLIALVVVEPSTRLRGACWAGGA